jgi:hypothetical protein
MERAARLLRNNKYSRQILSDDDIVRGIWSAAVGRAIARHTCNLKMVRSTLVVEVEDPIWQKQLFALSTQIVARVQMLMGSTNVEHVEFRVAIPKRGPQRAESLSPATPKYQSESTDEAEQILDPVLKKVYRLSRKKATA